MNTRNLTDRQYAPASADDVQRYLLLGRRLRDEAIRNAFRALGGKLRRALRRDRALAPAPRRAAPAS